MNKTFRVISKKSIDVLKNILKSKNYNTYTIHANNGGWVYVLRLDYSKRGAEMRILLVSSQVDELSDSLEAVITAGFEK